jgi:uncharacterized Zn finger protein (UPF0148 family)
MSVLLCKICGFKTFEAYALKREGKLICPQCSTFYHSADEPQSPQPHYAPKFKFKIRPQEQST